jgi:hypothetical protein
MSVIIYNVLKNICQTVQGILVNNMTSWVLDDRVLILSRDRNLLLAMISGLGHPKPLENNVLDTT